jgi:plasmid stabilization system protein ParE
MEVRGTRIALADLDSVAAQIAASFSHAVACDLVRQVMSSIYRLAASRSSDSRAGRLASTREYLLDQCTIIYRVQHNRLEVLRILARDAAQ